MAKRGRYSNEVKAQADIFIDMMNGSLDDAFGVAFGRAEIFCEEAENGERDEKDAEDAVRLANYLAYLDKAKPSGH